MTIRRWHAIIIVALMFAAGVFTAWVVDHLLLHPE
jgi:hypothetical protein